MYEDFKTAVRYAMSIGFSPPRHGCHRSGFAIRTKTKAKKAARNISSAKAMVFHRSLKKRTISARFAAAAMIANTPVAIAATATDARPNGIISKLAMSHAAKPITSKPSAFASSQPRSAREPKAANASGKAISAAPSIAKSHAKTGRRLAHPSALTIALHVPPARWAAARGASIISPSLSGAISAALGPARSAAGIPPPAAIIFSDMAAGERRETFANIITLGWS